MNADRIRLLLAPLLLAPAAWTPLPAQAPVRTAAAQPAPTLDAAARKAVVTAAIAAIEANYVFPERVAVIAKALRQQLSSGGFDASSDPAAFAQAVNATIAPVARDRHLRLSWSPEPLPPMMVPGQMPDPAMMARQQAMMARRNFAIPRVEVLDGNIGYLKIDLFARAQRAGPVLASAMAFLQRTDAMIVDVRENGGGDPEMVALAVSYLVPPHTEINRFHQRGKAQDQSIVTLADVPGGRWSVDKPVYVLTSKRTASGAEEFAYDLQQLKRATVIGEATWGGANPGDIFPLDRHFAVFVPTGAAVNPVSGTNWEGVGVRPDVTADPAVALDTARRMALEKLAATATGERAAELRDLLNGAGAR